MATKRSAPAKRRYRSDRRARQAAVTKRDVLDAATELFATQGWSGTTLAAIAERAGVAVETVYSTYGSKKNLLRAALDVAIAGDAEPVPYAEREHFTGLATGTLDERITRAANVVADIYARTAGVWRAAIEAAVGDPSVDEWRADAELRRRLDVARSAQAVLGHAVDDQTIDLLWVILSTEAYRSLTTDRGYSRDDYVALMEFAMRRVAL